MTGLLVLVVGPSGSGKDTLMAGAADALAQDARFRFVRRVVTRPPAEEDHDVADDAGFAALRDSGRFALHWEAHGLQYGIPSDIAADLAAARVVVANVSRAVLAEAATRFPAAVIEVTAPEEIRVARLHQRGRETPADIAARLKRAVPQPEGLPPSTQVFTIVNDGTMAAGVAAFADLLLRLAAGVRRDPAAAGTD
jgi:phosphonate metabolism protein PhnN/1,5-bisphosphokinase (PRPP-forming)